MSKAMGHFTGVRVCKVNNMKNLFNIIWDCHLRNKMQLVPANYKMIKVYAASLLVLTQIS